MRNVWTLLILSMILAPSALFAQNGVGESQSLRNLEQRQVINQRVPAHIRNEYDDLMTKMVNGSLTGQESKRLEEVSNLREYYIDYYYQSRQKNNYPLMGNMLSPEDMSRHHYNSFENSDVVRGLFDLRSVNNGNFLFVTMLWALSIILAVLFAKLYFRTQKIHRDDRTKAIRTLERRYVHGEVTKEEFDEKNRL